MNREEAIRLMQSQIDYLKASLIYQDSGTKYSSTELDEINRRIIELERELGAL